ncbi:tRNA-queuosine alpha-mannosyltransferase domain-containing protein [Salinibius halmophilus]|uniref:tRNA-queuosine alpha-mannosyltransferase domain-containing protein n=1 Tax=Salinibius halmophilus TaxID=1853216 RepID=UPI000E66F599|nr:DUF3524 domain-containing protein [Salinibius halmophilus]
MMANTWLLSAYQADSHQAWVRWLSQNVVADWQVFTLPGRHFRWRIRGNPLSWLDVLPAKPPEMLLATSMVDLATLKGIMPQLNGVRSCLYFHENQFAYPVSNQQHSSIDPQMVQLYSALAADELAFNSQFNLDSFVAGVEALLAKMPDHVPTSVGQRILDKARVLPVPVLPIEARPKRPLIVWPHRWEYDKNPERLVEILTLLATEDVPFQLALLGARGKRPVPALELIRQRFANHIIADGRVSRAQYQQLLGEAQVVISTAKHEFQGLAVLEAVSAGCIPVVPNDLCYVEQYPDSYRFNSNNEAVALIKQALAGELATVQVKPWLQSSLTSAWQKWLQ